MATKLPIEFDECMDDFLSKFKKFKDDEKQDAKHRFDKFYYYDCDYSEPEYTEQTKNSIRIASWNLTDFTSENVDEYKIDMVSQTIIYHDFDIVALQEVGEKKELFNKTFRKKSAIRRLINKLNDDSDEESDWSMLHTASKIGSMYQQLPEYGVFLYNSEHFSPKSEHAKPVPMNAKVKELRSEGTGGRDGALGIFKLDSTGSEIRIYNFHLAANDRKVRKKQVELMTKEDSALKCIAPETGQFRLILGDFNCYLPDACSGDYKNVFGKDEHTNTAKTRKSLDGILVDIYFPKKQPHKVADIVTRGNYKQLNISSHKLIWVDISIKELKDYLEYVEFDDVKSGSEDSDDEQSGSEDSDDEHTPEHEIPL